MPKELGMDSTLTNNISQHPGVNQSGRIRSEEPSVGITGIVGRSAPSRTPQVVGEDEL